MSAHGSMVATGPLPRDLHDAAATLSDSEARYLVDTYYMMQEQRKRAANQVRALRGSEEPHATLAFFAAQAVALEDQVGRALDAYSAAQPLGQWARSVVGVGPVITAGLLAHIDVARHATVGHIWRFAGLDPTVTWERGQKRPWNAQLKTLCWKIGDSFVKFHNHPNCIYGAVYQHRKQYEVERDTRGGNAKCAAETLAKRNVRDKATLAVYESGHLPAGRLDLRARRYAVKLFLSHYHAVGYELSTGEAPPKPYALEHLGHADWIKPPNWPLAEPVESTEVQERAA